MVEGTWTIEACDPRQAASLAAALDLSDTTASVLVRRGYAEPERAASLVAPLFCGDREIGVSLSLVAKEHTRFVAAS